MIALSEFIVDCEICLPTSDFERLYNKFSGDHLKKCIASLIITRRIDYPFKRKFSHSPDEAYVALLSGRYLDMSTDVVDGRYIWENEERRIDFISLKKSYYVNILSDLFNEQARLKASIKKKMCPYDKFFTRQGAAFVAERVIKRALSTDKKYGIDTYGLREAAWDIEKKVFVECTIFKAVFAKGICDYFGARYVLDPCGGWGNRAFGCSASETVIKYVCTDPNPLLVEGYAAIKSFLDASPLSQTEIVQHHISFEQYNQEMLVKDFSTIDNETGLPDLVFTSPPFGMYEIYNRDDKGQSTHNVISHDQWISDWFCSFLDHAWQTVVPGGHFALYMCDAGNKIIQPMLNYMKKEERPYWGCIGCRNETWYPICIYVWEKPL